MSVVESVVGGVNAILKTLECAICLELLKTPVTTGCGHFFCKFCITKFLNSNYRSPCPLCKRPITRRSIQEAVQRQSMIQAVKGLAEECGIFTGVQFFSKENTEKGAKKNNNSSLVPKVPTRVQESSKSSSSKKRKSQESETRVVTFEDEHSVDKAKEKSRKSVDCAVEDAACALSNDEIILSTNKRHCQSHADSDEDLLEFPSLEDIMQFKNITKEKRKSDDMQPGSSQSDDKPFPLVLIQRASDSEIYSQCHLKQIDEKDISVIPDTNVLNSAELKNIPSNSCKEKHDADASQANENKGKKILNCASKFRNRLSNKNEKNAILNNTNQLNLKKRQSSEKSLEDKNKNAKKVVEYEFNAEQDKEMDVELFLSPAKSATKNDPSTSRGKGKSRKWLSKLPHKNSAQLPNSSIAEESLISKFEEAENFQLETETCASKSSSVGVKSDSNEKEAYGLNETDLPLLDKTSLQISGEVSQKETLQLDEIAGTAISVQTVASPEVVKRDSVMKSPGWSRVKQVGKDFRVRKFSKLHVRKNTSNSCPSEVPMDLDSAANISPLTEPISENKLKRMSDPVAENIEKDSGNKEKKNSLGNMENKSLKTFDLPVKSKSCSNIPNIEMVAIGNKSIDDECCTNDEINESFSLINETEIPAGEIDVDYRDHESNFPSPLHDEMSSARGKETIESSVINFQEPPISNLKNAKKCNDIENRIASSVILDCCNENLTKLPASVNLKETSIANSPLTYSAHRSTDDCNFTNISKKLKPSILNLEANYESEFMEVDVIENAKINSDINSYPKIGVNNSKNTYDCNNYLAEDAFMKQSNGNIIDTPKIVKERKSQSKYDITETASTHGRNVHYAEQAQQTSQRLLNFCKNNQQCKTSFPSVSPYHAIKKPSAMLKLNELYEQNDSFFNQPEISNVHLMKPLISEKTKVVKRECLTLDEIQEAFSNSNASGNSESVRSVQFLSGDFRLDICVSEQTLNISVLKIVGSDSRHVLQTKGKTLLLSEKNIQTSTPIPSPTAVLPSSNVESESSQPENQQKEKVAVKAMNPFPFLSEYFSDPESTEQLVTEAKESSLNDSEVFPFVEPMNNASGANETEEHNKNEEMACDDDADENVPKDSLEAIYNSDGALDDLPATQPCEKITSSICNLQDGNEELFCEEAKENRPIFLNGDEKSFAYRKQSKSPDFLKSDVMSQKFVGDKSMSSSAGILNISGASSSTAEKNKFSNKISPFKSAVVSNKSSIQEKVKKSYLDSKNVSKEKSFSVSVERCSNSSASVENEILSAFNNAEVSKSYQPMFDDSGDFSSDPDMAFAMECVAPLKNIAEHMKTSQKKQQSFQYGLPEASFSSTGFPHSSKKKGAIKTFEELISKPKDSFQKSNVSQKPSRLSLKLKKKSKKFKRIERCDSEEDSDLSESSKNESSLTNLSKSKNVKETFKDNTQEMSKVENLKNSSLKLDNEAVSPNAQNLKSHDLPSESLQDNSIYSSFVSDDMADNSSEFAMEIDDIDKKILSVVEKLKQCGHADFVNQESQKQDETSAKGLSKSADKVSLGSCDSEDSTDIFSQSVPPTPPDIAANNNDSTFKASVYSHK